VLLAGLFGHRRPDDPFYIQWLHTIAQWLSSHWTTLAVVIPVAGALAAGLLNHYLAVSRENRSRRISHVDVRGRVHKEIAARLILHCRELSAAIDEPRAADTGSLRADNAALTLRCREQDVVEALGTRYVAFVDALDRERRTLERFDRRDVRGIPDVAGRAISDLLPFIAEFGESKRAREFRSFARR
jgi:hypothetical protein